MKSNLDYLARQNRATSKTDTEWQFFVDFDIPTPFYEQWNFRDLFAPQSAQWLNRRDARDLRFRVAFCPRSKIFEKLKNFDKSIIFDKLTTFDKSTTFDNLTNFNKLTNFD